MKNLIFRIINSFGYNISKSNIPSSTKAIINLINSSNINLVLDVGANQGQYATRLIKHGFKHINY